MRAQFGLPAQMACSVPRQVGATYKGLWTKAKKHAEARRLGYTKRRFKGLDNAPRYGSPTLIYVYGHDYSLKTEQRVSLLTRAGRIMVPYQGYSKHIALLRETAEIGEAKLWYDRSRKRFYLLVSLTIETPTLPQRAIPALSGWMSGSAIWPPLPPWTMARSSLRERRYAAKADHYARLRKRCSAKALARRTRRRIVVASERDG